MNVVDLKILIPASPEFIWRFLGDLSAIPQWQEDVVSVAFLSTQREGVGARWRLTVEKGSDIVAEASAWYDTLGYEYRLIDGAGYSENQGRIRLNEVTDGTLARWTFQYELGGVLGGLRNAVRMRRATTQHIQASLRNLHHLVMQESGGIPTHEAKATMRDAPDVDERGDYQPRHPSSFQREPASSGAHEDFSTERQPILFEPVLTADDFPPVLETDTKPNPVVLAGMPEAEPEAEAPQDDTRPIKVDVILAEAARPEPPRPVEPPPAPLRDPGDSADVSVFELFGLRRPSAADAQPQKSSEALREILSESPPRRDWTRGEPESAPAPTVPAPTAAPEPAVMAQTASPASISGLRRRRRRLRPKLRSHN